jgi:DNA gyrase subunit A
VGGDSRRRASHHSSNVGVTDDLETLRSVPDARDGLRPVDRRVLWVMNEIGLLPDAPYRRSATIIGEVRQRFPGQGWRSAYNALVRMVQDFALRYPLIDGQGNFGSLDGDPAADANYTEARLTPLGAAMFADGRTSVDAGDEMTGPNVFPSNVPNLLINGASTNETSIPPHNLGEVVSALVHLIDHPDAMAGDLQAHIKGPDFPTGGCIQGLTGIRNYQETGRGEITVRAHTEIETSEGATQIIVSDVPYRMNVASMIERIADEVRARRIDGIADLRNESGRDDLRIAIGLKPGVNPDPLLRQLSARTPMQSTFAVALTALVPDPRTGELVARTMSLKELLERYIAHRDAAIARRTSGASRHERMRMLKGELLSIGTKFGDKRRTEITDFHP